MSAELDRKGNGEAAVMLIGQPAWHREGTVLPEGHPATRDLALAMEVSGTDFEVEKRRHAIPVTDPETGEVTWTKSLDSWSVVRTDRQQVIGTVGDVWQPLQNAQAFGCLGPALEQGLADIETMGSLSDGRWVWLLAKVNQGEVTRRVFEAISTSDTRPLDQRRREADMVAEMFSEVLPYAAFVNNHSGQAKATIKETGVRIVCRNTLDLAMGRDDGFTVEVEHTTNVQDNYKAATALLFANLAKRFRQLAIYRDLFQATVLPDPVFQDCILDVAVPIVHLERKIQRRDDNGHTRAALEKASSRRSRIRDLWEEGAGHTGDHSAWEAWQGVIQWLDHDEGPTGPAFRGSRLNSLQRGSLGDVKGKTFRKLMAHCSADE